MACRIDELMDIANAISRGEVPPYQHNECYTAGAFDLLLINPSGGSAYELLLDACGRFHGLQRSGADLKGYYYLLSLLARRTNTTEMPPQMPDIINEHPALSGELKEWYRYGG